ncbi:hypothetical protein [uncultured Bacteroides sp.]|uniref:hypothetical protein n=1 Tax=uncultured Bacteroides sp. TaxID=162156 RepID=UPI0026192CF7|nr:hypothetical protein [uncultured Bacteroides sp.]
MKKVLFLAAMFVASLSFNAVNAQVFAQEPVKTENCCKKDKDCNKKKCDKHACPAQKDCDKKCNGIPACEKKADCKRTCDKKSKDCQKKECCPNSGKTCNKTK